MKQLLRSLYRDKLNTLVLIVSMSVGFASFNLILIFLNRELGTDNFHAFKDRIYALKSADPWVPGGKMYQCRFGSAEYMKENFTQVEDYCRVRNSGSQKIIVNNEVYYDQPPVLAASKNFFSFFSYQLQSNNPETVLESGNNVAISSDLALKFFGTEDPVGKVIRIVNGDTGDPMVVTGIFKKPAQNTQIKFEIVRLIEDTDSRCYVRLSAQASVEETEILFSESKEKIPVIHAGNPGSYYLEPLTDAYFNTSRRSAVESSRNRTDLLVALIIGLIIIGVALFNYIGIITNRFLRKNQEYRIRSINGSSSVDLISRFMLENSILLLISFIFSLYLMLEAVPFFNTLTNSNISDEFIFEAGRMVLLLSVVAAVFLITLLVTCYKVFQRPSLYSGTPISYNRLRIIQIPVFNIFQIASSVALIICSIVILMQMNFISDKPIGLDKDVVEIKIPAQYRDKTGLFKTELLKSSSVSNVSIVGASPVLEHFLLLLNYQQDGIEKQYSPAGFSGDEDYLDVLGIQLVKGEGFSGLTASPGIKRCLINQTFANLFPGQDLVGKGVPGMVDMIITGIVEDFHYSDLKSRVGPAFISFDNKGGHLLVKAYNGQTSETREVISGLWKELIPDFPVNTESVGDRYEWFHRNNRNFIRLIGSCSLISIFLSMIGIFAISYQQARLRTKEIGIRKINGANVTALLMLINTNFLGWIVIAFCSAVPVAWYAMHKWLENYAYKTDIKWWVFLLAGMIVLVIAILTLSFQSWRAATRNPVEALRYE